MQLIATDIDIDCYGRDEILKDIKCISARIDRPDGKFDRHNTGVYFQRIPNNPMTNVATLDHKIAGEYGYFKVDFLNVNMYEGVRNETHLKELIDREPPWDLFVCEEITDTLFQLSGHHRLLANYPPKSIEDLAMVLAIIRPSKAYLQGSSWDRIQKEVWIKDVSGGYQFRRGHAISYAIAVVVNLNLIIEQASV